MFAQKQFALDVQVFSAYYARTGSVFFIDLIGQNRGEPKRSPIMPITQASP